MADFNICVKGEVNGMSLVQATFTFTVNPAAPPLAVSIANPPNLQVGVAIPAGTVIATVTGGVAPYSYAMDPNSQPTPPGTSIGSDGSGNILLTGTPTSAGTFSGVVVDVTDAAAQTKKVAFK